MKATMAYLAVLALGLALGWIIGANGPTLGGLPVTFICAIFAYLINWAVFVPSWAAHSERFYDLTGAATYLSLVMCALALTGSLTIPGTIISGMVAVWCLRLGIMLFRRISQAGEDIRFRKIKHDFVSFLGAWTTQGLWVVMTLACALVALTNQDRLSFDIYFFVGAMLWCIGFIIEVVADNQKGAFRADPENSGRFITSGLWAWSQHPNYFGEILLWVGIAVMTIPVLEGWSWIALTSPVFVWFLLTKVSGIPMLDKIASKRWGDDPGYLAYTRKTSKLVPMPPKPR